MAGQVSNTPLELLSNWLDQHQQTTTKVILLDSNRDNIYSFQAAFFTFVLEGEINLTTTRISNGSLSVTAPVWGRVNMANDISGNLSDSITARFNHGPNITGQFTLSLDRATRNLVIQYDFDIKFIGQLSDTLALFPLPAPGNSSATAVQGAARSNAFADEHKLFDKFLNDHFDANTGNFVITSYKAGGVGAGLSGGQIFAGASASSQAFTFTVAFLGIFELEGTIDPSTLGVVASLYVRVPLWGRMLITPISGSLRDGIKLSINTLIARGTFGLLLSGKEVRALVDVDVKFVGKIKDNVKLFTLPF